MEDKGKRVDFGATQIRYVPKEESATNYDSQKKKEENVKRLEFEKELFIDSELRVG